ncbi:MAG: glycosyltransferase family 4 protein [Gallionellaceae bacterium]
MNQLEIVVEEFNSSGGLRILTAIANVAAEVGIKVALIYPAISGSPFFPLHPGVRLCPLRCSTPFGRLEFLVRLFVRQLKLGVCTITSSYRLLLVLGPASSLGRGLKPVLLVQGLDRLSLVAHASSSVPKKMLNAWLLSLSGFIASEKLYVSDFLRRVYGKPGTVIQNFVSPVFLTGSEAPRRWANLIARRPLRIGYVGTSAPNKGFDIYCEIIRSTLLDKRLRQFDFEFFCATQDPVLLKYSTDSKLAIKFSQPSSDAELRKFYRDCDIFLSLSVSEGFSLPTLEAMASGCVVICTNSGGLTDFTIDKINAIILTERSAIDVIDALVELSSQPNMLSDLSAMARETAQAYTYERFSRSYCRFFYQLGITHENSCLL